MTIEEMKEKLKGKIVEPKTCQECVCYNCYYQICELIVEHKLPNEDACENFGQ
jgi:hypothetical protein